MLYENLEEEYKKIFENKVLPFIKGRIERNYLSEPVYYLLESLNINRFRSGLPIIMAREYEIDEEFLLPVSAFCELTFTTAMAQDDFYDNDISREGLETAHKIFGVDRTLLSCDYINHRIISILNSSLINSGIPSGKVNKIIGVINEGMATGYLSVLMEINSKKDLININEDYLKKIYLSKTIHGRMLLDCTFLMMEETEKNLNAIKKYGNHLAMAGQLKNDIYDFTKHKKYRGLSDLDQGHITWPLFILINSLGKEEKIRVLENLANKNHEELIKLLKDKKIIEKILSLIDHHVTKAKKAIKGKFPNNVTEFLETWAEGNRHFSKIPRL